MLQVTPAVYAGKEEPNQEPEPQQEAQPVVEQSVVQQPEPQQDLFSVYCRPSDILIECNGKWYRPTGWVEVEVKA